VKSKIRAWWAIRRENYLRKKSMRIKRYWRATSKSGMVDLGHVNENEAISKASKMGPLISNDWENAIIIYDDGTLPGSEH